VDRKRDEFLKEGQHVMEHPNELPCRPPKWKNQILKDGARRCVYKKRQCTNDYMDINNARM